MTPKQNKIGNNERKKADTMLGQYRVLDLTDEKGLYCGQLLGSLGADVIKIEKPGGDPARNIGPFFHDIVNPEKSLFWFALNTNKKGITLNIESAEGQEIFKKMVNKADAVIESFAPGYMDKLGLGYPELAEINEGLIMTSISFFGQTGPYRDFKASDLVCWAMGGVLFTCGSLSGEPPARVSHVPQAFLLGSADAAWGTVMALYHRRLTGEGQYIDVSIQESVENCAPHSLATYQSTGSPFQHVGSRYAVSPMRPDVAPNTWQVKDGHIAYTIFTGETGARMNAPIIKWMSSEGMADEYLIQLDWNNFEWGVASGEDVDRIVQQHTRFFKTKTVAQIIEEGVHKRGAAIQPMYTISEVVDHPQLKARGYWQELEHPELGQTIKYPGAFCKTSETACGPQFRAPLIGEHNQEIYGGEMGFSRKELADLEQKRII